MRYIKVSIFVIGISFFMVWLFNLDPEHSVSNDIPLATNIATDSLGGLETTLNPTVAVSENGVVYVIWPTKGQQKVQKSTMVSMIPDKFLFVTNRLDKSCVPAITVNQNGNWSKLGLLIEGKKECCPLWSWCEGENLHLLVVNSFSDKCNHLIYSPTINRWNMKAELPFAPSEYDSWRQVGNEIHIAYVHKAHVHYLFFDGKEWNKPIRIEKSKNETSFVTRVRLAIDRDGVAHVAWWIAHPEPNGIHGYATIKNGIASAQSLKFIPFDVHQDNFDLGINPDGRLLLAYKANLPPSNSDSLKVHLRYWDGKGWTKPIAIGGEGQILFGDIIVIWTNKQTMVSWLSREKYTDGSFVTINSVRRYSIYDGTFWSTSRKCAWEGSILGGRVLMGAIHPGICVDRGGQVHMVWGSSHCVVTHLNR